MFQVLNLFIGQLTHATYNSINTFTLFKFHLDAQFISNWPVCFQFWNNFVIIIIIIVVKFYMIHLMFNLY